MYFKLALQQSDVNKRGRSYPNAFHSILLTSRTGIVRESLLFPVSPSCVMSLL